LLFVSTAMAAAKVREKSIAAVFRILVRIRVGMFRDDDANVREIRPYETNRKIKIVAARAHTVADPLQTTTPRKADGTETVTE